jgi:hypothetical protein
MKKIKQQLLTARVRADHARCIEKQSKLRTQYAELEQLLAPEDKARALLKVIGETNDPKVISELTAELQAIKTGPGYGDLTPAAREAKSRASGILSKVFHEFRESVFQLMSTAEEELATIRAELVRAEKEWLAKWELPWEPVVSRHVDQFASEIRNFKNGLLQDANQPTCAVASTNAFTTQLDWFKV